MLIKEPLCPSLYLLRLNTLGSNCTARLYLERERRIMSAQQYKDQYLIPVCLGFIPYFISKSMLSVIVKRTNTQEAIKGNGHCEIVKHK